MNFTPNSRKAIWCRASSKTGQFLAAAVAIQCFLSVCVEPSSLMPPQGARAADVGPGPGDL